MGRPKGSKNKPKIACPPPDDRPEPPQEVKCEAVDVRLVALMEPGSHLDGVYVVGKRKSGRNYVAKLCYLDRLPITKELKKKLGIE